MSDRGRPKSAESRTYKDTHCRFNREEYEQLDNLSVQLGMTKPEIIRLAVSRMAADELKRDVIGFDWGDLDGDYVSPEEADMMDDEW